MGSKTFRRQVITDAGSRLHARSLDARLGITRKRATVTSGIHGDSRRDGIEERIAFLVLFFVSDTRTCRPSFSPVNIMVSLMWRVF